MRFIWTRHVLDRLAERGITEEEVERCVRTATTVIRSPNRNTVYRAIVGGRRLKVVVARTHDTDTVKKIVTAAEEDS